MAAQTPLNLLTRDGAVAVTFAAVLTGEQYDQLFRFCPSAETKDEMRILLAAIAAEWGVEAAIDDA